MFLSRVTACAAVVALATAPCLLPAQTRITSPKEFFGHEVGADYQLPNYTKLHAYFAKVANESDRVNLDTIGYTEEGRPQIMAIVSSPENLKNLAKYKEIARKLALAEGVDSAEARRLAKEGKTIVWIDGGLHATEVLGAQQLIEDLWQFASYDDEETTRFRNDCIILLVHANPDGMELVSDWYMKESDPLKRSTGTIPRLYEKYAGHDDNRDSFMNALKETTNMSRVAFIEWHPQILYNHHQTGPAGAVMFAPPFRDPANYFFPDAIVTGIDRLGAALHSRMIAENKPGTTMRTGSSYSTWWNGGVRTVAYFHNMIGLLTETIGNPTPSRIPFVPERSMRSADLPFPILPQEWHFRQSIDYSITANRAVLDIASKYRETFLYDRWKMGRDEIAKGNADTWIVTPRRLAEVNAAIAKDRPAGGGGRGGRGGGGGGGGGGAGGGGADDKYFQMLRRPEDRMPRGYILSAAQPDFPTATKFVQALQKSGIDVMRSTAAFNVGSKAYPAGSWVIKSSQAFRPHVLDMFEPQDHPNDFRYPGGPPIPPYDNAGWTLAMQMGVQFDRVLDKFDGPFEKVNGVTPAIATTVAKPKAGYFVRPEVNDAATVANRLAKKGAAAYRLPNGITDGGQTWPAGTWFIPAGAAAEQVVQQSAKDLGVSFGVANAKPAAAQKVKQLRVALVDRYGGSMPSGWTRLVLEKFEFPYTTVFPKELDAGNLRAKYDVIVLTDGAISDGGGRGGGGGGGGGGQQDTMAIPAQYRASLGRISPETTVPQLKAFLEAGGRIVTIGSSIALGKQIGLPIDNYMTEGGRPLPGEKYYIPGSLLEVALDTSATIAAGMPARPIVMFDNSPVMKFGPDAAAKGLRAIATFDTETPLKSGWAWGQALLKGGVSIAEAKVGQGTLWLFGPEILFRSQPHGTYKFLLNALNEGFERPAKVKM